MPDFMELFGSLTARALNAKYGLNGTVIEKRYNVVTLEDEERFLYSCAYTLANPCAADLVSRARHWKGVTTARMRYGETITLKKPRYGLWARPALRSKPKRRRDARSPERRGRSTLPETVTFELARPPGFDDMSDDELRDNVLQRVEVIEEAAQAKRNESGKKVLGMKRVRAQHFRAIPGCEDMFGRQPTVSASDKWGRIEGIVRRRVFESAYKLARMLWLDGDRDAVFPNGTWLMRKRFGVRCLGDGGSQSLVI
jgi:hypothetical protein